MLLHNLQKQELIHAPNFLPDNTLYLTQMGSVAYGVSGESSDVDIYGYCMPPKELAFPHLAGEIPGFGSQIQRFECWTEHHIKDKSSGNEYDFSVYGIIRYFQLCMENNPNMTDSLFTPRRCVLHTTRIGELVREKRRMFLHKGSFHRFRGYAYAQLKKLKAKETHKNPKRQASIDAFGFDVKNGYHVVRLALEAEQILVEHDLDLERNSEVLKAIRRGEWSMDRLEAFFEQKERHLDDLYHNSTLPARPDESAIKELLLNSLEEHYGSISATLLRDTSAGDILKEMQKVIDRFALAA